MGRKYSLKNCHIVMIGQAKEDDKNLPKWVANLSGHMQGKIDDSTTHVVVNDKQWKNQNAEVQKALELKREGRDLKIVSYTWLVDCCHSQSKRKEGPYLWEALDKSSSRKTALARRKRKRGISGIDEDVNADEQSINSRSTMVDVFKQSTAPYVDPKEQRRLKKTHDKEEALKRQMREREKREKAEEKRRQLRQAQVFEHGVKKSRADLGSDNHHIYVDDTGFYYDIVLTKIDTKSNRNERWTITIFETNSQPHRYTVNTKFAATARLPENRMRCVQNSEFLAAIRAFKEFFHEKTGGEWDSRICDHFDRAAQEAAKHATREDSPGSDVVEVQDIPFDQVKFEYHPPPYGAKGILSEKDEARLDQIREKKRLAEAEEEEMQGTGHPDNDNYHHEEQMPDQADEVSMSGSLGDAVSDANGGGDRMSTANGDGINHDLFEDFPEDSQIDGQDGNENRLFCDANDGQHRDSLGPADFAPYPFDGDGSNGTAVAENADILGGGNDEPAADTDDVMTSPQAEYQLIPERGSTGLY